jgi:hypothetical protein
VAPWASRRDKPPLGNIQDQSSLDVSPLSLSLRSKREPSERICLRKGCGNRYCPQRWNQRFCQDPQCKREVQRWQAAKRQRRSRESSEGRERHRQRERQRRQRQREQPPPQPPQSDSPGTSPDEASAWSRRNNIPEDFCDRPGCYEPPRPSPRVTAKYCGDECRSAMANVRDRERKWSMRHAFTSLTRRTISRSCGTATSRWNVVDYRKSPHNRLSFSSHERSEFDDHQTSSSTWPRPPPAAQ